MILPLGWYGSILLGGSQSRIYPNTCAKSGCGPTVVSKGGGAQTDKGTLHLYIVDVSVLNSQSVLRDDVTLYALPR